jgi:hypothetical protein
VLGLDEFRVFDCTAGQLREGLSNTGIAILLHLESRLL